MLRKPPWWAPACAGATLSLGLLALTLGTTAARADPTSLCFGGGARIVPPADRAKAAALFGLGKPVAFHVDPTNTLVATDARGATKVLVDGRKTPEDEMFVSSIAADARYVYFSRLAPDAGSRLVAGFFRVLRDGSGMPERLASEPGPTALFVAHDGFLYWRRSHDDHDTVVRRPLGRDGKVEELAQLARGGNSPLVIRDGRIYFVDRDALWSVALDGAGGPIRHVALGQGPLLDVLVEPPCVYWLNETGAVMRSELRGGFPEIIGHVPRPEHPILRPHRRLATDGAFLYANGDDAGLLRIGRSAAAAPSVAVVRAKPLRAQATTPPSLHEVVMGDGWGCARLSRWGRSEWHCWEPGAKTIEAQAVPWLEGQRFVAGPDRLCAALPDGTPRCVRWPDLVRAKPSLDLAGHALLDRELAIVAGGTFTCAAKRRAWTCIGDDTFGQLAGSAPLTERPGVRAIGLGVHHGCSWSERTGLACWGRNDLGQLGFTSTTTCATASGDVACARSPRATAFAIPEEPAVFAADAFTCIQRGEVSCWGATRDGLFGTAEACPPSLRRAWPTPTGPVAAPRATCASVPAPLSALPPRARLRDFHVGPRGACGLLDDGRLFCGGAIPTPELNGIKVAVSLGNDPSACIVMGGIVGKELRCWGGKYARGRDPRRTVTVRFASPEVGAVALDATLPAAWKAWPKSCAIEAGCDRGDEELALCPQDVLEKAQPWNGPPASGDGEIVVRGPLGVLAPWADAPARGHACSPVEAAPMLLGDSSKPLLLEGFDCRGDDSRRCCNAPAFGQTVVAKGRLTASGSTMVLRDAKLCTLPP